MDVAVLIDMLDNIVWRVNLAKKNGIISDLEFLQIIDPLHKRTHNPELNDTLDEITKGLMQDER